jgi:hypothetical protein
VGSQLSFNRVQNRVSTRFKISSWIEVIYYRLRMYPQRLPRYRHPIRLNRALSRENIGFKWYAAAYNQRRRRLFLRHTLCGLRVIVPRHTLPRIPSTDQSWSRAASLVVKTFHRFIEYLIINVTIVDCEVCRHLELPVPSGNLFGPKAS